MAEILEHRWLDTGYQMQVRYMDGAVATLSYPRRPANPQAYADIEEAKYLATSEPLVPEITTLLPETLKDADPESNPEGNAAGTQ
jgi:hypothetical protein